MAEDRHYDLVVIGTGAAGSAAWLEGARQGRRVAVFENDVLGGECPTFACVPTKALLKSADVYETATKAGDFGVRVGEVSVDYGLVKARKDLVVSRTGAAQGERPFREHGVDVILGKAAFVSAHEVECEGRRYTASRFIIATGSKQRVPAIPGLAEVGFLTFREAINLISVPRSLFVFGGGPVACEFAQLFSTFDSKVIICDRNSRLLHKEDREVGELIGQLFAGRGVELLLDSTVVGAERAGGTKKVLVEQGGQRRVFDADEILIAAGKAPDTDLGLEAASVDYTEDGIVVDEHLQTSNPAIYAAGDSVGPYLFTHAASYQGAIAGRNALLGNHLTVDYRAMPRCVFTSPEVATVGLTEEEAHERGLRLRTGFAELANLGRANTSEEFEGFVKVLADGDGRLVGASIVASRAGEMVHELALAINLGASAAQVAATIHAFPTFSEAIQEACAKV